MRGQQGGSVGGQEVSAARRKRDERRRRAEEARWAAQAGPAITRMARKRCSGCESTRIAWGTVSDRLQDHEHDVDEWLRDLADAVGVPVGPALLDLESWKCRDCGHSGVFGPTQLG